MERGRTARGQGPWAPAVFSCPQEPGTRVGRCRRVRNCPLPSHRGGSRRVRRLQHRRCRAWPASALRQELSARAQALRNPPVPCRARNGWLCRLENRSHRASAPTVIGRNFTAARCKGACRRETPTTMMTRKKKRRRTRIVTIGRQLSGNPNPTSSAHPLSRKAIPSAPIATGRRLFRVESGSRGKATDRAARENVSGSRSRARHEGKAEQDL